MNAREQLASLLPSAYAAVRFIDYHRLVAEHGLARVERCQRLSVVTVESTRHWLACTDAQIESAEARYGVK